MASGPEHWLHAQQLLHDAAFYETDEPEPFRSEVRDLVTWRIAAAQVHATLALAYATALGASDLPCASDLANQFVKEATR